MTLTNAYYYGYYVNKDVAKFQYLNILKYFLFTNNKYNNKYNNNFYFCSKNVKYITDIIELTESLYLLQLIEQQKFSLIGNKDISEQLNLFTASKINKISFEELKKVDSCGITDNAYDKTIKKAEEDKHILKLIENKRFFRKFPENQLISRRKISCFLFVYIFVIITIIGADCSK